MYEVGAFLISDTGRFNVGVGTNPLVAIDAMKAVPNTIDKTLIEKRNIVPVVHLRRHFSILKLAN
jgi:hypothetical protein